MLGLIALLQVAATPTTGSDALHSCEGRESGEILVCSKRIGPNPYRLPKLPHSYDRKPIRAETDAIPGVHTVAHVEQNKLPDGAVSKRMMITFKLPF